MYHNIHLKLASWSHAFDSLEFDKSKLNSIFSRSKWSAVIHSFHM